MTEFKNMMKDLHGFNVQHFDSDWRWKLLEELYQKNWKPDINTKVKIPKIIHQIWVGGKPLPKKYKWWMESWKRHNPNFEYKLWTDDNISELNLPDIYYKLPNAGPKSDVLRYHLLNEFGGIYVDTDFECFKSFEDLSGLEFYTSVGYQYDNWSRAEIYPGLMACTPHHSIIKKLVNEVDKLTLEKYFEVKVHVATSSYFFTKIFFEVMTSFQEGVVATPPDIFYPFPNSKQHHLEVGRKYLKPCSYAIHHWEVSWMKEKDQADWVQGDKYVGIADFVYSPRNKAKDDYAKYPNTFDPANLKVHDINFVYCCTMYLGRLLRILNNLTQYKFVVINHNGDQHVDDGVIGTYANAIKTAEEPYEISDNIVKIYTVNPNTKHPKVDHIAVGLENSMWKSDKKEIILRLRASSLARTGFALMNHSINTNKEERTLVYNKFKPMSWVSTYDKIPYQDFYRLLATHKFIFNPMGNCFDNHRMWEAWYLGCIPISKSSITIDYYKDMPHVIVKDWDEVTEEFLNSEYDRISKMNWNEDELWFEYWRNKILST